MNEQNIATQLQTIDLLPQQAVLIDGDGTGVDVTQFVGSIAVMLTAKCAAGTAPTLGVKLQESDASGSGYTDIVGATFTSVTDAGSSAAVLEKIVVNVDAAKKYIRAVKDIGGTDNPQFLVSCVAVGLKQIR
jgi:hypothetical protein